MGKALLVGFNALPALTLLECGVREDDPAIKRVAELALQYRLPAISTFRPFAEGGGLMSYWVAEADIYRRAAVFVDKILKGAKPADLPVEQPTKFELIINLKTAKALGLTIPPTFLFQADEVIR